jgi:eukaryotic-like serine/threonine-protein kinase
MSRRVALACAFAIVGCRERGAQRQENIVAVSESSSASVIPSKPPVVASVKPPTAPSMIRIPAGAFMMGAADPKLDDTQPVHRERVREFWLDRTEVTVELYLACVRAGKCHPPSNDWDSPDYPCNLPHIDRSSHPMNCIWQRDATAYCAFVGKRLPTEIEWEFAARGTSGRTYPNGEVPPDGHACTGRKSRTDGLRHTCPVGSFPDDSTPEGVLDMAGNVSEYTSSKYCPYTASGIADCDAPSNVIRGGMFAFPSSDYPAAIRDGKLGRTPAGDLGFRCASDSPPKDAP